MSDIFAKLITPKRIHIILGIFVVANILATLKIVSDRTFFNSSDFIAYSIGARMILDGQGKNLYKLDLQSDYWSHFNKYDRPAKYFLPIIAPATTGLLYVPYLLLDPLLGGRLAMLTSLITLMLTVGILLKLKPKTKKPLVVLMMMSSWFLWTCVWQAQPTALMFLLISLSVYFSDKKGGLSLFLFLLALLIKPHYFITATPLLFILTADRLNYTKILLVLLVTFALVNLYIIGGEGVLSYIQLLTTTDNSNYGNRWYEMYTSQSLVLTLLTFLNMARIKLLAVVVSIFVYIALLVAVSKNNLRRILSPQNKLMLVIQTMLFFSYHVLSQDMALSLIPLILITPKYREGDGQTYEKLLPLAILTGHITVSPLAPFYGTFLFILVLYYLIYLPKLTIISHKDGVLLKEVK